MQPEHGWNPKWEQDKASLWDWWRPIWRRCSLDEDCDLEDNRTRERWSSRTAGRVGHQQSPKRHVGMEYSNSLLEELRIYLEQTKCDCGKTYLGGLVGQLVLLFVFYFWTKIIAVPYEMHLKRLRTWKVNYNYILKLKKISFRTKHFDFDSFWKDISFTLLRTCKKQHTILCTTNAFTPAGLELNLNLATHHGDLYIREKRKLDRQGSRQT